MLDRCCSLAFPAWWLWLLLMDHSHQAYQCRFSPLACPHYWLLILFSLVCTLVLCPHFQGGPDSSPACSKAIPYVRQLWQPHVLWKVLHQSYPFSPLTIIIITVLRASSKRRFIRPHKHIRYCPCLDTFGVLRKYPKFHWHLQEIFLLTGWLKWVTRDRAKTFSTLTIQIYFYRSGLFNFLLNAYYLNKLLWTLPVFSVTSVNCSDSLRGQRWPWRNIWRK